MIQTYILKIIWSIIIIKCNNKTAHPPIKGRRLPLSTRSPMWTTNPTEAQALSRVSTQFLGWPYHFVSQGSFWKAHSKTITANWEPSMLRESLIHLIEVLSDHRIGVGAGSFHPRIQDLMGSKLRRMWIFQLLLMP